ncbi:MAG: patatin-like phospholipase family protein [Phycisphaerae bacterium]|nr:patatin-like phospholipase family protein [Phycisphaerae bacterium]
MHCGKFSDAVTTILKRRSLLPTVLALGLLMACAPGTRVFMPTTDQVSLASQVYCSTMLAQRDAFSERLLKRLEGKLSRNEPLTIDILALSSGGQYGAFAVGLLQGWSQVQSHAWRRPEFDVVTGVSTGALIAPFAFVGTDESICRIDQLYQEVTDDLVVLRDIFFFLPWRPSFFDNRKLAQRIECEVTSEMVREIAAQHAKGRILLVGATDLDLGRLRVWDLGHEADLAAAKDDRKRLHRALLASAAIPGAFPPVEIDHSLYADGACTQQAISGVDREQLVSVVKAFSEAHPNAPTPRVRIWVIVNGKLDPETSVTRAEWVSVSSRALYTVLSYGLRTTLREFQLGAEALTAGSRIPCEFHYVAVPADFEIPVSGTYKLFDPELMGRLSELGRKMGADPSVWRSDVAPVELPSGDMAAGVE